MELEGLPVGALRRIADWLEAELRAAEQRLVAAAEGGQPVERLAGGTAEIRRLRRRVLQILEVRHGRGTED